MTDPAPGLGADPRCPECGGVDAHTPSCSRNELRKEFDAQDRALAERELKPCPFCGGQASLVSVGLAGSGSVFGIDILCIGREPSSPPKPEPIPEPPAKDLPIEEQRQKNLERYRVMFRNHDADMQARNPCVILWRRSFEEPLPLGETKAKAIAAWNRRATPPAPEPGQGAREAAEAWCDEYADECLMPQAVDSLAALLDSRERLRAGGVDVDKIMEEAS